MAQVKKQYQRSRMLFHESDAEFPVFGTIASQFNDPGTNTLFAALVDKLKETYEWQEETSFSKTGKVEKQNVIIPNERQQYLRDISMTVRRYHEESEKQAAQERKLYQLKGSFHLLEEGAGKEQLKQRIDDLEASIDPAAKRLVDGWDDLHDKYSGDTYTFQVRGKEITMDLTTESLSGTKIPKVALPTYSDWGTAFCGCFVKMCPGHSRLQQVSSLLSGKERTRNDSLLEKGPPSGRTADSTIYQKGKMPNV